MGSKARTAIRRRVVGLIAVAGILIGGLGVQSAAASPPSDLRAVGPTPMALSGSSFDPGYIISDYAFYHRSAMTQAEIQAFLDAKIGSCQNSNCLNILRVDTTTREADRTICTRYAGAASERVAAIIFKVQQACGISAKVILVTLQKEQSLATHKAPSLSRLDRAMGYGCPDDPNRPGWCSPTFAGVYNQIYKAAWQFKRYSTPDLWGNYHPGVEQIKYHPTASCGTKTVTIRNHATAALYNYTPYTPNAAALANLRGTGNSCSAYGNRNFWVYYNDWFGSPVTTVPEGVEVERISGADRFEVSAGVAKKFATNVPALYIADGLNFPDALSAGAAAAAENAPLLVVRPTEIPDLIRAEILRLKPAKIVVVGGPSSVSPSVFDQLTGMTPAITRIDGADRYEVSRNLAEYAFGTGGADVAYVAHGGVFSDALSAGGAAAEKGGPVILVNGKVSALGSDTLALLDSLGTARAYIAGGPASVSSGVEQSLKTVITNVQRVGGADRYIVSGAINREAFTSSSTLYVALGTVFPDALSGVPLAGAASSPLYIIPANCIPPSVLDDIRTFGIDRMVIVGGVGSLTSRIEQFSGC